MFSKKQVEAAFQQAGLLMLPDIAVSLPKGVLMDYAFLSKGSDPLPGTALTVYATIDQALRNSVADRHGVVTKRYIISASRTLRVRNALLVFGPGTSKQDERALTRALTRLGTPVSP